MRKKRSQLQSKTKYPHNLVEGKVLKVNYSSPRSFVLDVNTSKISTAKIPSMKKTIKLTSKTKLVFYNMTTKKESSLKFSKLKKGDCVVIGTKESIYEKVNNLSKFTATKVSKFVNRPIK